MASAVTLMGLDIEHRWSLQAMLEPGGPVNWVPDSSRPWRAGTNDSRSAQMVRRARRVAGRVDGAQLHDVLAAVDGHDSELVLAYWGTEPLADLHALRRHRPSLKLVLMVLCYPSSVDRRGVARQRWLMRRAGRVLDGVMFPNEVMREYFHRHELIPAGLPSVVVPPCWRGGHQSPGSQPAMAGRSNLIYTGRTDLSSRTVHPGDDLRALMSEILDSGIELHHARSVETADGHPDRRPFEPLPLHELIVAMGAHDASLVAYDDRSCDRDDRFWTTVPDRAITSAAAGVPVAVPRRGYAGVKEYLAEHPAVIEFDSAGELAALLADRAAVAEWRSQAWAARHRYRAESHGATLRAFLDEVLAS